jgi:hypothetical protein
MLDSAQPKALFAELFEAVAAAMGLDSGREHLTFEFEDGRLRRYVREAAPVLQSVPRASSATGRYRCTF